MCGIAAVWSQQTLDDPASLAERLDRALAHRGPDGRASSLCDGGRLLLIHRRLAIIDPSPAGAQPMSTPDGRYTMIFNGEIYNHRAVRVALEQDGERFTTESDTEVLLRLLAVRGPGALAAVRGMFALALWDHTNRTLTVARDRFGIKPLYAACSKNGVALASELRALLESGHCARDIDAAGVLAFLRWGAVPGPLTWLRHARAIEPGTWQRWSAVGSSCVGRFADVRALWAARDAAPTTEAELHSHTQRALIDSVNAHLVADVPVGVFLSGGLDSGALVSLASRVRPGLHTFTVAFDESALSEARFAGVVADTFGTVHHTLHVAPATVLHHWPSILRHMDQPTIDGVNSYLVSSAVAATGVKAVLSGIGGDELFGGYPAFNRVPRGVRLGVLPRTVRHLGSMMAAGRGRSWRMRKLQHAAEHADSAFELYRAVRGWTMPSELPRLIGPELADPAIAARVDAVELEFASGADDANVYATVARLESTLYMRGQLLRDTDVMSMAHGLEIRVPFVDHELVQAVWPRLGRHADLLSGKRLLVRSVPEHLPPEIVSRPKQGFTLPFEHWIDGPLSAFVSDGLGAAARGGWIAKTAPQTVMDDWRARRCHWSRPWGLAVLGHFLDG